MRLLKYEKDGRLTITSFEDNALPRYAILSHTWGADTEEVTFADLLKVTASTSLATRRFASVENKHSKIQRNMDWIAWESSALSDLSMQHVSTQKYCCRDAMRALSKPSYARFILSGGRISLVPDTNTIRTVAYLASNLYVSVLEHRAQRQC
jgi:hypothetical protein